MSELSPSGRIGLRRQDKYVSKTYVRGCRCQGARPDRSVSAQGQHILAWVRGQSLRTILCRGGNKIAWERSVAVAGDGDEWVLPRGHAYLNGYQRFVLMGGSPKAGSESRNFMSKGGGTLLVRHPRTGAELVAGQSIY